MSAYTIVLTIGDWSGDGHEKSQDVVIDSSLDKEQLEAAYAAGAKLLKLDLSSAVAVEYEDCVLSASKLKKFQDAGFVFDPEVLKDQRATGGGISLFPELFADLWLFTAKLGSPTLDYSVRHLAEIDIGGYGLFN